MPPFPGGFPKRGEVYRTDFGTPKGSEQGGRRPAVVVSNDVANQASTVVVVAAITSTIPPKRYRWNVHLPKGVAGMRMDGTIYCNQLRTLDKTRLERFYGSLDEQRTKELNLALAVSVGLLP